ncbi:MAG: glycosyltransferase family 2 protein [Desulfobacterales bacterium]|nr:glycosyltransferase family 2 protein [Desulfobacterales bacterium]
MQICCIILNYFGHQDTVSCVRSLAGQDELKRVVIVDNSADSGERGMLKAAFDTESQVEILFPQKNLGFSGGVNFAIANLNKESFDAFLLLNNDTVALPDSIRCLSKGMDENGFDMAAPVIYCFPERSELWARGYFYNRFSGLITHRDTSFIPGTLFYLSGCCILVHRQVFEKIGMLDASFFMYGEDIEFCYRAFQNGLRYGIVDQSRIYHKGNASSKNNSLFYEYHLNRCHLLLCDKMFSNKRGRKLSLVIKVIILAMRALARSIRYKNLNAISGYKQAIFETAGSGIDSFREKR